MSGRWIAGGLALLAACAAPRGPEPLPLAEGASERFAQARALDRAGRDAEALQAAREAADLDPAWPAPRRFLQDHERERLRGHAELGRLREDLLADAEDVTTLYLLGRIEEEAGRERFEHAVRLGPREPWGWHGLAHRLLQEDALREAEHCERRALALARDPFERDQFTLALVRVLDRMRREPEAARVLEERLADPEVAPADRTALELALTRLEQGASQEALRRRAEVRAETLIAEGDLTDGELEELVRFASLDADRRLTALARRRRGLPPGDPQRVWIDLLEASRLGNLDGTDALALALATRAAAELDRELGRDLRVRGALAAGRVATALELWRAGLPQAVLGPDGLPRDARLAELVRSARAVGDELATADAQDVRDLGDALLAAGWFAELQRVAGALPERELERAREWLEQARAGQDLLQRWASLLRDVDRERARGLPDLERPADDPLGEGPRVRDLDELLLALGEILLDHGPVLEPSRDWDPALPEDLADSPRLRYGPAGEVVHPGPTFSAEDERLGRGPAGTPVPGLAAELLRWNRFAIAGDGLGIPPDLTVLDLLLQEPVAGRHLGRPFTGTRAWCRADPVPGRAARMGARVAGAALHEGYWVDVAAVQDERDEWFDLWRRFPDASDVRAALTAPAPAALDAGGAFDPDARRSLGLPLGEGDRVRLALLLERGAWDSGGTRAADLPVTLDELVEVTCIHEEGHLCDRLEHLPLSEHLGAVIALLARASFTPIGLQQRLEYRAQLVALCAVPEPRLPLAEVLAAVEGGSGATPHAAGYRDLLRDLLTELERALERGDPDVATLDPGRVLLHQLHHLTPEALRRLALRVAEREGLVRGD